MSGRPPVQKKRTHFQALEALREEAKQQQPEALEQLGNLYRDYRRPNAKPLAGLELHTKADPVRAARYLSQACDLYQHRISALQQLTEGNSPLAYLCYAFDAYCKSRNGLRRLQALTAWYEQIQQQREGVAAFGRNSAKRRQKIAFLQWSKLAPSSLEDACKVKSALLVHKLFLVWSASARRHITYEKVHLQAYRMKQDLARRTLVFLGWKTVTNDTLSLSRQEHPAEDMSRFDEPDSAPASREQLCARKLGLVLTRTCRRNVVAAFRQLKLLSTSLAFRVAATSMQDLLSQVSALEESNDLFKERSWLEVMHWQRKVDEMRRKKIKTDLEATTGLSKAKEDFN